MKNAFGLSGHLERTSASILLCKKVNIATVSISQQTSQASKPVVRRGVWAVGVCQGSVAVAGDRRISILVAVAAWLLSVWELQMRLLFSEGLQLRVSNHSLLLAGGSKDDVSTEVVDICKGFLYMGDGCCCR
jgi:hypothetical protein